jgi:selenocysteine-specific elongation factor
MIIATAGHVDHGKTALIKALTGQHTDRTAEEQRRGMSIELGYAWMDCADGKTIDLVDVPGHEKFMRTLLAGMGCVDAVMLVVAADDGVMPQTLEHLQVLKFWWSSANAPTSLTSAPCKCSKKSYSFWLS